MAQKHLFFQKHSNLLLKIGSYFKIFIYIANNEVWCFIAILPACGRQASQKIVLGVFGDVHSFLRYGLPTAGRRKKE
jgi:hypothetical protein